MYILANEIKITEKAHERLCQAAKDTSNKHIYFLEVESGKLIKVPRVDHKKAAACKKEPQRFSPLPTVTREERRKEFVNFVEELGIIDVPELQRHLSKEIKKGASIEKLEQILENDPSGWIHGWVQLEHDLLAGRIEDWLMEPPLSAKIDPDYWFDDDCPVCQLMRKMEEENCSPTLTDMHGAFKKAKEQGARVGGELFERLEAQKERKSMEKNGFQHIGKAKDFKMPKWMECTWRRVPCGRDDCPICGRIKRDRQRHIERGEDPGEIRSVLEDAGRNLKEVMRVIKKDAKQKGFDITNIEDIQEPPEPEEFPFYQKVKKWNKEIFKIADKAELSGNWWIYTEAAADLFWYANILLAKVYRQLCNRWQIENGDNYGEFDYKYTEYVLEECLKILNKSLQELIRNNPPQKKELNAVFLNLSKLENQIIKI